MRIPRFFCLASDFKDHSSSKSLALGGDELHHLRTVLRLSPGDQVEIVERESSQTYRGVLKEVSADAALVEIIEEIPETFLPGVILLCGMTKPKTLDLITEKAVELGVREIRFFTAQRTQGRLSDTQKISRTERLERVIQAAIKQSGALGTIPGVFLHDSLAQALEALEKRESWARFLLALEGPEVRPKSLIELLQEKIGVLATEPQFVDNTGDNLPSSAPASVKNSFEQKPPFGLENIPKNADSYILTGPEGGLAPEEVELALSCGFETASLGPKTLRAETAAVVACALVELYLQAKCA